MRRSIKKAQKRKQREWGGCWGKFPEGGDTGETTRGQRMGG